MGKLFACTIMAIVIILAIMLLLMVAVKLFNKTDKPSDAEKRETFERDLDRLAEKIKNK